MVTFVSSCSPVALAAITAVLYLDWRTAGTADKELHTDGYLCEPLQPCGVSDHLNCLVP